MSSFSWTSAVYGDWSTSNLWSDDGVAGSQVPPGTSDDVTIDALGAPYVVTISSDVSASSLTVAGVDAAVSLQGETIAANSYDNGAGSTLSGFGTVAALFTNEGSVDAEGGTLAFTAAGDLFDGTLSGEGKVELLANADLESASVSVANLSIQGAGVSVTADDDFTVSSNFQIGAGGALAVGGAIVVTGVNAFDGDVNGSGTLNVAGGATTFNAGATIELDDLAQSGGTMAFDESLSYAKGVQQNAGLMTIGLDDVLTLTGDDAFDGTIAGLGSLDLSGSTATFGAATLTIASIVASGGETLNIDDNVSCASALDEVNGSIKIDSATLTLSGSNNLGGAITGGTLDIAGGVTTLSSTGSLAADDEIVALGAVLAIATTTNDVLGTVNNAGEILIETNGGGGFGVAFDDDVAQSATGIIAIGDNSSALFDFNAMGGAVAFAAGADEVLGVNAAMIGSGKTSFAAKIEDFGVGDSIAILGASATSVTESYVGGNTIVDVHTQGDEFLLTLVGNYSKFKILYQNTTASADDEVLLTVKPTTAKPVLRDVSAAAHYYETLEPVSVDPKIAVLPGPAEISSAKVKITKGFLSGDTLQWADVGGVVGSYDAAHGALTLTGVASDFSYATILDSIAYMSANANPTHGGSDTKRTLSFTVTSGAFTSAPATTVVKLLPPRPVLNVTGSGADFTQSEAPIAVDSDVTIAPSQPSQSVVTGASVKIGAGFMLGDRLSFLKQSGIVGRYISAKGLLILSGSASLTAYQTALESITFSSTSLNPTDYGSELTRPLAWTITAGGEQSKAVTTSIGIVSVDAAPTLVHGGDIDRYALGKPAIVVDAKIVARDVDNLTLASATAAISGDYQTGDTLSWSTALAAKYGLSVAFDDATGVLTFIGQATLAQYDRILETVQFASTSSSTGARTVTWSVSDGTKNSQAALTTIDVEAAAAVASPSPSFDFNAASGLIAGAVAASEAVLVGTPQTYGAQSLWLAGANA